MEAFDINLTPFFGWLLKTTIQASVLIFLILFIKATLRQKLPVRWHYYLWLLLLIRMALPWSPQSRISIFNLIPRSGSQQKIESVTINNESGDDNIRSDGGNSDVWQIKPVLNQATDENAVQSESLPASDSASEVVTSEEDKISFIVAEMPPSKTYSLLEIMPWVWLAGTLVLAGYIFFRNIILWKSIKSERQITDQQILELLEDCKMQMRIQTIVGVVVTDKVKSPALFGFVRPRLLLPQGLLEELDLDDLQYIFLHELAHLKRRDIYLGWVVSLLQVLHWFNPLIWFAFRRMRTDQELACDALTLSTMSAEEPQKYGKTIVNLFERFSQVSYVPSIAGILEDRSQLERRIKMITKYKKNSYRWSPLAAMLIIILGSVTLPDAISIKASERSTSKPTSSIVLRKVWEGLDVDNCGKISHDGKYLSYVDWDTGDLAIYEIATGNKRRLTNKGSWEESDEFAEFARWSPNSKQILYSWYNKQGNYDLRIIGLDDLEPRILYGDVDFDFIFPGDWSSDGEHVLAWVWRKRKDNGEVILISVMDGAVQTVKQLNERGFDNFMFSPEEDGIIYDGPDGDISMLSLKSGKESTLVKHPANDSVLGWGPGGKHLLFTSNRSGTPDIWAIKVEGGKSIGEPRLINSGRGFTPPMGLGTTTKGSFYYCYFPRQNDVYVTEIDANTGDVVSPPHEAINRFVGSNATPDYSPDGKYLAYVSRRAPFNNRTHDPVGNVLCIRSLKTGEEREFRPPGLNGFGFPRWSADSQYVLVINLEDNRASWEMGLYIIDAQTGETRLVMKTQKPQRIHHHAWSIDGKSIFLVRSTMLGTSTDDMRMDIVAREIVSGSETELLSGTWRDVYSISCSPDGRWLAVLGTYRNRSLRIMPVTGGEPRIVHTFETPGDRSIYHTWSADGKYIFLPKPMPKSKGGLRWVLWRIPLEDGKPQNLGLETPGFDWLSTHPDGRNLAFSSRPLNYGLPAVWVMENFLPEIPSQVIKSEPTPTLRQIEVRGRGTRHSRPSFDGKYFSDVERDTGNLIIRELASNKEWKLPVTSDPNSFVYESFISADGKKVAFLQFDPVEEDFDLCIVNLDGTGKRILMDSQQIAGYFNMDAWSPDGEYIFGRLEREAIELVRISADDGSMQVIKKFDQNRVSKVDVSPDGRYLAYSYREENTSKTDIFIYDLEQNQETPLVTHTAGDILLGWTPDGENIFFISDRNGTWDGWLVAVADGKAVGLPEMIKAGIGNINPIGFTKEGLFYYEFQHQAWNVYTAALDQSTGQVISEPMPIRHVGKDVRPDFSPDGRYLAYLSEPDRNKPQVIRIRTLATGQERELKIDLPRFEWLRWCPDSRHLLITNFGWNSPSRIYKVDIETGTYTLEVSSEKRAIRQAELSVDGKTLVYRIRGSGNSTWLIARNIETGDEKEILNITDVTGPASLAFWSLSPDGKEVAYSIREGEAGKPFVLKIMSVETGESRTLVAEMVLFLLWSPDGRDVLFTRLNELRRVSELCLVSAKGGESQKLFEWKEMIMAPRIHPDRQRIAFHSGGYVSEMWVMENFLPKETLTAQK